MDHQVHVQNGDATPSKRFPGSDHTIPIEVLLIGRDPAMRLYTDEVLEKAGFHVRAITPWEAKGMIDDAQTYALVVFSNTLNSGDISEIAAPLRQHNPSQKLLLMLGPDSMPTNLSAFDATLEALEGPAALIRMVRRLAESSAADNAAGMSA